MPPRLHLPHRQSPRMWFDDFSETRSSPTPPPYDEPLTDFSWSFAAVNRITKQVDRLHHLSQVDCPGTPAFEVYPAPPPCRPFKFQKKKSGPSTRASLIHSTAGAQVYTVILGRPTRGFYQPMNPNFGRPVSILLQYLRSWWPVAFAVRVSTYSLLSPQSGTPNLLVPQPV